MMSDRKLEIEIYQDKRNNFRYRIRAANWKILAISSEGYEHKVDCEYAIGVIVNNMTSGNYIVRNKT